MVGPFGCGSGGGGPLATPTFGSVEVGFVDSPNSGYQAISLNVVSVRLNPSTDPNVLDSDPNWVTITAPPGSGVLTGGELSLNLLDFQSNAMVFNTAQVVAQNYLQVEVVLDPSFPGNVIPTCPVGSPAASEGCVNYPLKLTGSTNLRTTASGTGITVSGSKLATLIIDISPAGLTAPTIPGGNYTATPTIMVAAPDFLGTVLGTVPVSGVPSTGANVTAELTGTNMVVATAPISPTTGIYTIQLPALATIGTTYDLFAAGASGTTTIDSTAGVTVTRSVSVTENFALTKNPVLGAVGGTILNGGPPTPNQPVVAATVNLLLPSTAGINCQTKMGVGCVVVATTTSSSVGSYLFSDVPIAGNYFVEAEATGLNTVIQPLTFSSAIGICAGSPVSTNCSFTLPNAVISGTVSVVPPPGFGSTTSVIVLAEQHNTLNLVGIQSVLVPASLPTAVPFTMQVPTVIGTDSGPNLTFDLIATAADTYLGAGSTFTGHSQAVAADIMGGGTAGTMTVECLGHGSVEGTVSSPLSGTHVRLFQNTDTLPPIAVQLQDSTVGQTGSSSATQYSFCVPPGNGIYLVQKFEQAGPTSSPSPAGPLQGPFSVVTPAAAPSPSPTPGPTVTPTPCPVCLNNNTGQCPGNCIATSVNPL